MDISSQDLTSPQQQRWKRCPAPFLNPDVDSVIFQQIDIDSYTSEPVRGKCINVLNRIISHVFQYV